MIVVTKKFLQTMDKIEFTSKFLWITNLNLFIALPIGIISRRKKNFETIYEA